ncbi:MAG: hypothetical protein AB9866_10315 [Syntrophobacteraceae bacterium]
MNIHESNMIGCCACEDDTAEFPGTLTCADKKNIFTRREQEVLGRIREASLRARDLNSRIRSLGPEDAGMEEALRELENLRQIRVELESERLAASEERMHLLGHL